MKRTIGDYLPSSLRAIERTFQGKEWPAGILTGFTDLDFMTGGIRRDLTVIGSAPGMGLSSLARQIGMNMARADHRGAIFDFELTPEMVTRRLLAMEAGLADMKLRTGLLKRDELGQLMIAAGKIDDVPLMLEERTLYTITELCERLRALSYEDSCEWVIIDRFDHILPDDGDTSPEEDLENISRALGALQKELKIPIIVLCHVTGDTKNRFPGIAFHHELDALLRVADTVLFLRRTDTVEPTETPRATVADGVTAGPEYFPMELSILRQRDGPVGSVFCEFSPLVGTFRECPAREDET